MGIIQKQSIKGFIYSYLGVILGFITTGYLMPEYLEQNQIGLLRVLVSYATLLAQFSSLGFGLVALRMFPYFRDPESQNHGFFGLFTLISLIGLTISSVGFIFYYHFYLTNEASELLNNHILWVFPLTIFTLFYIISDSYQRALYDAIIGTISKEIIQRVFIFIAIILFIYKAFPFSGLVAFYSLAFATPPFMILYSLYKSNSLRIIPDFKFINKKLKKNILNVSLYGLITSFSGILVINIDVLMIERYIDLSSAGIYTIAFFFGALVLIPSKPVTRISSIIIAESFKTNDLSTINSIYKKSSLNLTIIGLLLILGISINMENIIKIIGEDYRPGYYVIILIAAANLIEMSAGVINQVIFYSDYYKYSAYFIIFYAFIIIISNVLLIPIYGITGAAFATFISKLVFNFSRIIFIYNKIKIFPYQIKLLIPLLSTILIYKTQQFLPTIDNFSIDIILRSGLVSIFFISIIYFSRVSEDLNNTINNVFDTIIKKIH